MTLSMALLLVVSLAPERQTWLFDDFESAGHVAAHGLSWIVLGDELLGGTSSLAIDTVSSEESGHALRLKGSIGEGPTAFTGAWAPLDGGSRPVDLGAFAALRFLARGEGTFQAGLRSGPATSMANFMGSFTPGPEWNTFEIPFESLTAVGPGAGAATFRPEEVHWLGVTTAPGATGPFHLEIDDVALVAHEDAEPIPPVPVPQQGPARTIRLAFSAAPAGVVWRELARDPSGDGRKSLLPDAISVAVMENTEGERIWFRIGLQGEAPQSWLGLNLALDVDGNAENGTVWWGSNSSFRFDRLVSVWLFRAGENYEGIAGTADAASVANGVFMENGLDVQVTTERDPGAFLVSVPRSALAGSGETRFIVAVGSAMANNDDVPDSGAILLTRPSGTQQ
jgi:hypothetical protein